MKKDRYKAESDRTRIKTIVGLEAPAPSILYRPHTSHFYHVDNTTLSRQCILPDPVQLVFILQYVTTEKVRDRTKRGVVCV